MAFERVLLRRNGFVELADDVARVRPPIEELGPRLGSQPVRVAKRSCVLCGGFSRCAHRGGALCRRGRVLEHRIRVSGRVGMIREPRQIGATARRVLEGAEGLAVQLQPAVRRQRLFDREASELVTERDAFRDRCEHAGRETLLEPVDGIIGERLEEPELRRWGHDRDGVEQRSCHRAQPRGAGEHSIANRLGDLVHTRGERLGDEEWIAGSLAEELLRIDTRRRGQLCDCDG